MKSFFFAPLSLGLQIIGVVVMGGKEGEDDTGARGRDQRHEEETGGEGDCRRHRRSRHHGVYYTWRVGLRSSREGNVGSLGAVRVVSVRGGSA